MFHDKKHQNTAAKAAISSDERNNLALQLYQKLVADDHNINPVNLQLTEKSGEYFLILNISGSFDFNEKAPAKNKKILESRKNTLKYILNGLKLDISGNTRTQSSDNSTYKITLSQSDITTLMTNLKPKTTLGTKQG
jgi:hypothetical protein